MTERNTPLPADSESDPVHLAAADWLVRLQSTPVSIDDTLAWQAWLGESPAHARAFARMEEVSQALRDVSPPGAVPAHELACDRYDASLPLKDWAQPYSQRRRWTTVAFAASFTIAALAIAHFRTTPHNTFATAVGETRNVTLADGSVVALGGDTRIEVALSRKFRAIELSKGEALFTVASDLTRPFTVRAGAVTVSAIGTAFNVQRVSDHAIVSVTAGRVLVEPAVHFLPMSVIHEFLPKLRAVRLDAGEQTTAGSAGIEEPTRVADPTAVTAWQTGRLAFRLQPLRDVLEDVNRYARKPIVLSSTEAGALLITGTVERDNIVGWVASLERAFDLEATEEADRIVLRAR